MRTPLLLIVIWLSGCAGAHEGPPAHASRPAKTAAPASQKAASTDPTREAQRACEHRDATKCFEVTRDLARRKGNSDQTVQQLFRRACAGGSDAACLLLQGKSKIQKRTDLMLSALTDMAQRNKKTGTTGEPLRAVLFKCRGGIGAACAEAALRYEDGKGVSKDAPKGHRFHRLACALGHWFSCNNLTLLYQDKLGEKVSRRMFSRMCDGGSAYGCYWIAARLLSGLGLPKRPKQGLKLMKKSCDGGHGPACYSLALSETDESKKETLLQRGCKGGCPDSCQELKQVAQSESQVAAAKMSCRKGEAKGCHTAGMQLMAIDLAKLPAPPRRQKRALAYLTKARQMKHGPGCTELGNCFDAGKGVKEDKERAARLFGQGCKLGDAGGCSKLALAHDLGEGVKKNVPRAMALYGRACKAGQLSSCQSLGERHLDPDFTPRNPRKGARLLMRACKGGEHEACESIVKRVGKGSIGYGLVLRALKKLQRASKDDVVVAYSLQQLLYDLGNKKPDQYRPRYYKLISKDCRARKPRACAVKRLVDRRPR